MTTEQKPSQSEAPTKKPERLLVQIGEAMPGGSIAAGEWYITPGTEVHLGLDTPRFGMRHNASRDSSSLIRTKTASGKNDYLISRGVMINFKESLNQKRLVLSDIWGSPNVKRDGGINLVVGQAGKVGDLPIDEVEGVLVKTGTMVPTSQHVPHVPDTYSLDEAKLAQEIPDYYKTLNAAIEHIREEHERSLGHTALQ